MKCAEENCFHEAALIKDDVARCVHCHRDKNGGRIIT